MRKNLHFMIKKVASNAVAAFLHFCTIAVLSACNASNEDEKTWERAEMMMETKADSAAAIIGQIPESVLDCSLSNRRHDDVCRLNFCRMKAAWYAQQGNFEETTYWLNRSARYEKTHYCPILLHQLAELEADRKTALKLKAHGMLTEALQMERQAEQHERHFVKLLATVHTSKIHHPESRKWANAFLPTSTYKLIVPFLALMLASLVVMEHRERRYSSSLHTNKERMDILNQTIRKKDLEIISAKEQMEHIRNVSNLQLGRGKEIYENIKNGGLMKNISVEDEQCFIDYYAFLCPKDFEEITAPYKSLTLRHTTYLILSKMDFSDKAIQQILFISPSTIRNYRSRMNRNLMTKRD